MKVIGQSITFVQLIERRELFFTVSPIDQITKNFGNGTLSRTTQNRCFCSPEILSYIETTLYILRIKFFYHKVLEN